MENVSAALCQNHVKFLTNIQTFSLLHSPLVDVGHLLLARLGHVILE